MKKISIVIPTFNQAQYLPICIESAWFQDWPEVEIVVVNDCSTDNTSEVLDDFKRSVTEDRVSYACNYNEKTGQVERCEHMRFPIEGREFRTVHHPENRGLSAALNTGFKEVTGEFCTFIASDDILLPSAMSEMVKVLERNEADFVYADMHIVDDHGNILRRYALPEYTFEDTFCRWYLCGICKLYRREMHEKYGYYREDIKPQDHEMFLRFAMNGAKFIHIPKVLANVRIHDMDRQVANHLPENWDTLYRESAELVLRARQFLREQRKTR
jgi:glycosyltransferase involved in cell wall biosynthesis